MYVEDLIIKIRDAAHGPMPDVMLNYLGLSSGTFAHKKRIVMDEWHTNFITSICEQIEASKPLSTRQAASILKLIGLVRNQIVSNEWLTASEVDSILAEPSYKQPLYESTYTPKEVRWIGGNLLAFRFKDRALVTKIKALGVVDKTSWLNGTERHFKSSIQLRDNTVPIKPRFEWLHKIWIVPLYRHNIRGIIELITKHHFAMDLETDEYMRAAIKSLNQPSLFASDGEVILANVCDNPILSSWITEVAEGISL